MEISLNVNGTDHALDVPENTLLVEIIREHLGLTGTHVGCDTSQCGACTVHLNGRAVKACSLLAGRVDGATVVTIEGVGTPDDLHPMQAAFRECHALQCGFCTPGMIMRAIDLVETTALRIAIDAIEPLEVDVVNRITGRVTIDQVQRRAADAFNGW